MGQPVDLGTRNWPSRSRGENNDIVAKHLLTRRFWFLDRSLVYSCDSRPSKTTQTWPVSSGCEMTCFWIILFILFTNTILNRLGFGMLTVGTAIFY